MKGSLVCAIGKPEDVLTPENVIEVFNMKAVLVKNPRPLIAIEDAM